MDEFEKPRAAGQDIVFQSYTAQDYLQCSVWSLSLFLLISVWGFVWGTFSYVFFVSFARKFLKSAYNLEMMQAADEMFFLDDDRNLGNIVTC